MTANARLKPQLIAVGMIALTLLAACGKSAPTVTLTLPPVATLVPSTAISAPPTDTPTSPRTPTVVPTSTPPPSPQTDSDGGQIVFYSERDGDPEIYVIEADGSGLRQLTDNNASDMAPAWSPNGTHIVFVSDRDGNKEIYVMGHDGSEPQRLTNDSAYESHPAWSHDGARIAFVSERDGNEEIYVMSFADALQSTDGSEPQRLTNDPAEDMRPAWSPDGEYLLFNSERDGNWEIYVIDVAAVLQGSGDSAPRRLTDSPGWELFPVWSPDGMQIAYRCGPPATPRGDICVVNAQEALQGDFAGEQRLTSHSMNDENPSWSPDGTQIVFQSDRYASSQTANTGAYNYELMIVNSDGSDVRRLTDAPGGDYWPAWSPRSVGGASATPASASPPGGSLGDVWTRPADGMAMVYAPGGAFRMGSDVGDVEAARDESPQHSVVLDAFWIDQTEVSVAQFRQFVTQTGYETEAEQAGWSLVWVGKELSQVRGADWQHPQGPDSQTQDDHPVVAVSWNDALIYCKWAGARLPTEAEWEYAARGSRGLVYPWGDDFDCSRANLDDETQLDDYVVPGGEGCDGYAMAAPVGNLPDGISWCNALDMAGNVWEWVADWYGGYPSDKQANPTGPKSGGSKVLRGGGWYSAEEHARAAKRAYYAPDNGYANVGFRCALSQATPAPTATDLPPTPSATPGPTPTVTPIAPDDLELDAPMGNPPTLDGTLSADEWSGARAVSLDGGELHIMHDGVYLYLGIRSDVPGLGSVCVDRGEKVSILHSSASLGTAVYERDGEDWEQSRDFVWTNGTPSFLEREGWLASDANEGASGEMEYQIMMPEGALRLAVTYLKEPDFASATAWPAHLADDCRKIELLQGYAPARVQLFPETWMTVTASTVSAPPPPTLYLTPSLVLVGGTLIDGTGAEPLLDAVLVIQGERIVAVGPRGEVQIPPDARWVDLPAGATLLPGFINAHVHNAYQEYHLKTWAQEGVTTVRDVGAPLGFPYFSTRDRLGANPELARVVSAGPLVTVPEGYPIAWNDFPSLTVTSPEDARQKINQLFEDGADLIKITLESSAGPILSPEEAAAIVETAHAWGAPVTAHVTRPDDLLRALDAGVDDVAHIVPDRVSDEVLRRMIEMGVYWVPTFAAFDGRGSNNLSRFMAFGGQVALGNDGGYLEGLEIGMPMREIELMQSAGMTPMDVIVAATRNAAHVCRLSDSLGTLQVGKLADVLVVEGDPLQDLHALGDVRLVVHGGVVIRGKVGE